MVSAATRKRRTASYIGAGILPGQGGGVIPGTGTIDLLNIAGQSNAVAADANLFVSPADDINDPRVLMWSETGGGTGDATKAQKILPYSTPLPFESDNPPGVGPYLKYIQNWLLTAGPNDRLVVICSARGGTRVHNGRWAYPSGDLYTRMVNGSKNALAAMKAMFPTHAYRFTTIWQQGESDIGPAPPQVASTPAEYKTDMTAVMTNFRAQLASVGITDDIWLAGGMTQIYMAGFDTATSYAFEQAQAELYGYEQPRAFFTGQVMVGTSGDIIHGSRADQLVNGDTYWAKRPRAVYLTSNAPDVPGPITIAARTVTFKASNCSVYGYQKSAPGANSWGATQLIHAPRPNAVGDALTFTVPGTDEFDLRMVALSNGGISGYTNTVNYTTPSATLPTPFVDLDPEAATESGGAVSVVNNTGSYGGTLIPENATGGVGSTSGVTVSTYGTNNKKVFDLLPSQSFRGSGNPVPAGSWTSVLMFFTTSPITSNTWVRTQNDLSGADSTVMDFATGFASSGAAIKAGVNSTTQQLLSSTALTSGKNMCVAWVYDATAATWTVYLNGAPLSTIGSVPARSQLSQTATRGYKVFGYGRAVNQSGIRGRVMAYREYGAALTAAQIQTDMANVVTKFGGISWG